MPSIDPVLAHIDANLDAALARLMELIKIPSISTDPQYAAECEKAAHWLAGFLNETGFTASVAPTAGRPAVLAHSNAEQNSAAGAHFLFYGHYDVQPVDPLSLWEKPPFEPYIKDSPQGRLICGRGASDDKGQLLTFLEACRAYKAVKGALPCRISIFLEGEEESGSPSLVPFMKENAEQLKADLALICDTGLFDDKAPAIITQLRGLFGGELTIYAADKDLHSGSFGGIAANPARILAKILAGLHDETGRITLPNFYDGVEEPPQEIKRQWEALEFSEKDFLAQIGLRIPAGENGRSGLEMLWSRPTCEINGLTSGYQGAGFKTVLPAKASAKISFRLVGTQDPHAIESALIEYVKNSVPADCRVEFKADSLNPASQMHITHDAFQKAKKALQDEWETPASFIGAGGSIPVAGYFQSILGMDSLLTGFGKDSDQIHSPNEKYDLSSFHKGIRSWARFLGEFEEG